MDLESHTCKRQIELTMGRIRTLLYESSPELSSHFYVISLEERELKTWKEIEAMELEERVANLEAKSDAMKRRHEEWLPRGRYNDGEEEERLRLHAYGTVGTGGAATKRQSRDTDYGRSRLRRRSRRRSKTRHHRRTSSRVREQKHKWHATLYCGR